MPNNALPSDLLENVLCGVALGLGVLGIIVGLVLIIYFRKPCSGGTLGHLEGPVGCGSHTVVCGQVCQDYLSMGRTVDPQAL